MEVLELLYKKHRDWCDIVESFGVNSDTAEDIVMEMYIKLDKQVKAGTNIMYNETEINYYYVYRALRNLFLDLKKKESLYDVISWSDMSEKLKNDYKSEVLIDYDKLYEKFNKELESLYWYDRKVFEIIDSGESFQNLSDKTTISYYSLYNTYRKVKKHLKDIFK